MTFMDQMLDRLAGREWFCFLDGHSMYKQSLFFQGPVENHFHI